MLPGIRHDLRGGREWDDRRRNGDCQHPRRRGPRLRRATPTRPRPALTTRSAVRRHVADGDDQPGGGSERSDQRLADQLHRGLQRAGQRLYGRRRYTVRRSHVYARSGTFRSGRDPRTDGGSDRFRHDLQRGGQRDDGRRNGIATIAAGVAHDAAGNGKLASTSTDNSVTFDPPPIIGIVVVAEAAAPKNDILEPNEALKITWAVSTLYGIASQTMTVDGKAITPINGPYRSVRMTSRAQCTIPARSGHCAAGSHTYTIRADRHAGRRLRQHRHVRGRGAPPRRRSPAW